MREGQLLYEAVRQYIRAGIQSGLFENGQALPPIQEFCKICRAAPSTVRLALQQLEDEGYLSLQRGRPARVTWNIPAAEQMEFRLAYYSERLDALTDQSKSVRLLFTELYLQGIWAYEEPSLSELEQIADQLDTFESYRLVEFFISMLHPLGNTLIYQLIDDCYIFSQFRDVWLLRKEVLSSPEWVVKIRGALKQIIAARRRNDPSGVIQVFRWFYTLTDAYYSNFAKPPRAPRQIPFQWRPYKGRPQYCYMIAADIVQKIWDGTYPPHRPLPGIQEFTKAYDVHEGTIRQALKLLNKIDLVETRNGIGSRVRHIRDPALSPDWAHPSVQKIYQQYLQSLQLLAIVCKPLTVYAFPMLENDSKTHMLVSLKQDQENGWPKNSFRVCLNALSACCGLEMVKEVFLRLQGISIWGECPLLTEPQDTDWWSERLAELAESLETENAERFASLLRESLLSCFKQDKNRLLNVGVALADTVLTLSRV